MINGHGDDIYSYETTIVSNFSSNVYTGLNLTGLEKYLCEHISTIHSYPEPDALSLRNAIASTSGITPYNIAVTNGAIEAIYLIAQTFRGYKSCIVVPTFSEYEDACKINNHRISYISSLDQIESDTQIVWLCNPNNPTGKIYNKELLEKIIADRSDIYFVIDQSYEAFTSRHILTSREAVRHKNIILLHSLTKCYAIPGLRLGYLTAEKELTERIKHFSMPWSVNQLAQLAGKYLLENVKNDYADYIKESKRVQELFSALDGLKVYPSDMHFFVCELQKGTANQLKTYLIDKYGILIRDASNFRGLNDRFFRIAVQSEPENNLLIKATEEWIKHCI